MGLRLVRVATGVLLGASGALLYVASWHRWADPCPLVGDGTGTCEMREDHLYDFWVPGEPWEPVGNAAQLAGFSLLVLALAFVLLPWALTGRRPGPFSALALVGLVPALGAVGVAAYRSGVVGSVVDPVTGELAQFLWLIVPPLLVLRFSLDARGWPLSAAILLVLGTPLVAAFTYAVGSFDARPWYEAIAGLFTVASGLCLLVAAAVGSRPSPVEVRASASLETA